MIFVARAAEVLLGGGVIAYPTEGVFGLGCLPDDPQAVSRLLRIKQRDPRKGLILIASKPQQLRGWISTDALDRVPAPEPSQPITWIVAAGDQADSLLRGEHSGIAVRLTTNPVACALCDAVDAPLTSTSANLSGRPVARNKVLLHRQFGTLVDFVMPGDCGPASGPSEIRVLDSGDILRTG